MGKPCMLIELFAINEACQSVVKVGTRTISDTSCETNMIQEACTKTVEWTMETFGKKTSNLIAT